MAITTLDGYIASQRQRLSITKTASITTVATFPFSLFDGGGIPGAGVLAGTSTAAGVVPTDATVGTPTINAGTGTYYLTRVDFGSTVACRIRLADMLFKAGAYAFNASTTLASQPSYSSRVPGGTDFTGCQIWIEVVTAFTGIPTFTITYTNADGTTGRTTGAVSAGTALTARRYFQMPLQAGDNGVQKIESVTATVATVGTFNVLVLRPLWTGRVRSANDGDTHGLDRTGMPEVFPDSALIIQVATDATATGIPDVNIEIASA